jgi:hypothetical protein
MKNKVESSSSLGSLDSEDEHSTCRMYVYAGNYLPAITADIQEALNLQQYIFWNLKYSMKQHVIKYLMSNLTALLKYYEYSRF